MIIYIMIALVIASFLAWMLIKNGIVRFIVGSIALLALLVSVLAVTANFANHWGMKQVTTTQTKRIYTAGDVTSPAGTLIVKRLGTKADRYVLVYRTKADAKKATAHFVPDQADIENSIKKSATYKQGDVKHATVTTSTKRWTWQSDTYKWLLNIGDQDGELISQKSRVVVPAKTWAVMTAEQAAKLGKQQAKMTKAEQAAQVTQMQQAIAKLTAGYMQKHPQATKAQVNTFVKEQTAILMVSAINAKLK